MHRSSESIANLAAALTGGAVMSGGELAIPTISQAADAVGQN